jgi:hypothetical protein
MITPRLFALAARAVACLFFLVCFAPGSSAGQSASAEGIFTDAPLDMAMSARPDTAQAVRWRMVTVDNALLLDADPATGRQSGRPSLVLNLFDDVVLTAAFDRMDFIGDGRVWVGHVAGVPLSTVTLSTLGTLMSATIVEPRRTYTVRYAGFGVHQVSQVDQTQFPPEAEPIRIASEPPSPAEASALPDTGGTIDVMVVYTPAAVAAAGGTVAIAALVNLGVSETNTSYANSGISQRMRLVYSGQVSYTETTGNIATDLYGLSNYGGSTSLGNAVASLRDAYGADIVSMWGSGYTTACGVGWEPYGPTTNASSGFNVIDQSCVSPNYSFEHEMGHNMSAQHDWYVDSQVNYYTYSHGHVYPAGHWRTIMAYNNLCSAVSIACTRLLYWSNPGVAYAGVPMGVTVGTKTSSCYTLDGAATTCDSDDHRALNNTASYVASWKASVIPSVSAPLITSNPSSVRVAAGGVVTFSATATGSPTPTVQWQVSTDSGFSFSSVPGASSTTFSFAAHLADTGKAFRAVFSNSQGAVATAFATLTVLSPTGADLDGDGRADLTVWRPSNGHWCIKTSTSSYAGYWDYSWGLNGDVTAPGDYDGDGRIDLAVWRPSIGQWFIKLSSTGYANYWAFNWGVSSDVPVVGDYDGDGRADLAVWRPSTGTWFIKLSSTGYANYSAHNWGANGDVPVVGDYDGDGRIDLAVWRPSTGQWFIRWSSTDFAGYGVYAWGTITDTPLVGDFDGDHRADIAVWRPSTGQWFILWSSTGWASYGLYAWGTTGDTPMTADFDGDGFADLSVWRPSTGQWFICGSASRYASYSVYSWGTTGDVAVPAR